MFHLQVTSATMELHLLVCVFLLTWSGTTFGQQNRPDVFKVTVKEGSDAILPCSLSSKESIEFKLFDWRKDGQMEVFKHDAGAHYNNGLAGQNVQFRGRVSHFPDELKSGNASIIIRDTKVADSGNYTCDFPRLQPRQIFHIKLLVVGPDVFKVTVEEGSDAILPCSLSSKESIEFKVFDWRKDGQTEVFMYDAGTHYNNGRTGQNVQFRERVQHFPDEVKSGNASIIIRDTKVADSGNYTCDFPLLQPRQIFHIKLLVGAAQEPYITTLDETKDGVSLQCAVRGAYPKPEVVWKDSDGNIVPAEKPKVSENERSYSIILRTTVNKAGRYRCEATQKEIHNTIYAETYVPIKGAATKPFVTSLKQTNDWTLLQCEVQGAFSKPKLRWQDSAGNNLPAEEPQLTEKGGKYDVILQITVTKTDNYRCVSTQEEIKHQIHAEIDVYIHGRTDEKSGSYTGWIVGLIVGLVVAAVLGALLVLVVIVHVVLLKKGYRLKRNKDSSNTKAVEEPLKAL